MSRQARIQALLDRLDRLGPCEDQHYAIVLPEDCEPVACDVVQLECEGCVLILPTDYE